MLWGILTRAVQPDEEPCAEAAAGDAGVSVSLSDLRGAAAVALRSLFFGTAVWLTESLSLDMAGWTAPHCKLRIQDKMLRPKCYEDKLCMVQT